MPDEVSQNSNQIDPAIDLEKKKIELEIQKLQVEKYKARWSAMSAIVPILVAFVTVAYGAWSLNQTAKVQFGTKVVEVAMQNSRNELDSIARAKLMGIMFQEYVPADFKDRLGKIDLWKDLQLTPRDWKYEPKTMVLHLLAEYPEQRTFILSTYEKMWPGDSWTQDLHTLLGVKTAEPKVQK